MVKEMPRKCDISLAVGNVPEMYGVGNVTFQELQEMCLECEMYGARNP